MNIKSLASNAAWLDDGAADVTELYALCQRKTDALNVPLAAELDSEIPIYDVGGIGNPVKCLAEMTIAPPHRLAICIWQRRAEAEIITK